MAVVYFKIFGQNRIKKFEATCPRKIHRSAKWCEKSKKTPDQFLITHHHTSLILLLGNLFCTHVPPLSHGGDV
jgi:hypothetical protein